MMKNLFKLGMAFTFVFNTAAAGTFDSQNPAGRTGPGLDLDAHDIFYSMYDQSIELKAQELGVLGTNKTIPITFGAEKEGSSSKILRVMSPSINLLFAVLKKEPALAIWFAKGLLDRTILQNGPVLNSEGQVVTLNQEALNKLSEVDWNKYLDLKYEGDPWNIQWNNKELGIEFESKLKILREIFPGSPFSFLKKQTRKELWERKDSKGERPLRYYDSWEPLYGDAEKYIDAGHQELNKGWEVIFKPQKTYADFEMQIAWFRKLMGSKTELFEAPGHQRVVMPRLYLLPEQQKQWEGKAAEVSRMVMVYLVLRGLRGQTGLLGAKYNYIHSEEELATLDTWRGPIRLEKDRFYANSIGVEFRTGMKDEVVRRFVQAVYASRLSTNDMSDLKSISEWKLLPDEDGRQQASDYGVSEETLLRAKSNWYKVETHHGRSLGANYLVPLWHWQNAPFTSGKKDELRRLTQEFIYSLAKIENPTYKELSKLISNWVTGSNLVADIEAYLTPKKSFDRVSSPLKVAVKEGGIDVNNIDLGNEFTARMPLKLKAEYDSNGVWEQTIHDMTPEEREARIKSVAETLKENFTGSREGVTRLASGSHGHSLSIAYELKDNQGRPWRVEWDGVSRNYDPDGNILEHTARGGHIEIVSPKYNPSLDEITAVYDMMEKESLVPDYKMGGSHINIDFEIFEKNPKALARFLTLFHQHRGIISFMFQHINRLRSAEPVEISSNLDLRLRNFTGTQEDLAKLLYNEKYFNSRQNRKTRYTQIDVSNYMGQVIPEEFIKPDFDVVKARFTGGDGWSKQFRVTKHKKLEFRLFDAAKDPLEAALQIKVVRALLNKALNDSSALNLPSQKVDHEAYVKDPQAAYRDLRTLVSELGLDYSDYSPYVTNKIIINKTFMERKIYVNWFTRAAREFPKTQGWGSAREKMRQGSDVLYSDRTIETRNSPGGGVRCERLYMPAM